MINYKKKKKNKEDDLKAVWQTVHRSGRYPGVFLFSIEVSLLNAFLEVFQQSWYWLFSSCLWHSLQYFSAVHLNDKKSAEFGTICFIVLQILCLTKDTTSRLSTLSLNVRNTDLMFLYRKYAREDILRLCR